VQVRLSTTAVVAVTVRYRVTGGSATPGADFTLAPGTVTFPALTTSRSISIPVVGDAADEPTETIFLALEAPQNATLASPATHIVRIRDDDRTPVCRGRRATIAGTAGDDRLAGTPQPDVIVALGGDDFIDGGGGDDIICGGPGDDEPAGGNGADIVDGGEGNDTLKGGAANDLVFGGPGRDTIAGGPGSTDGCDGGPGVDRLAAPHGCEATARVP
jgi:Ca2+-binding RTX toxin-like protein